MKNKGISFLLILLFLIETTLGFDFKRAMERAPESFFPFFFSEYYEWQLKTYPCQCTIDNDLKLFIENKIKTYQSWSSKENDHILRHNFQIKYYVQNERIKKKIFVKLDESDLSSPHFNRYLKRNSISFDLRNYRPSFLAYNYNEDILTIVLMKTNDKSLEFRNFKGKQKLDQGSISLLSIKDSYSDQYTPYKEHYIHQEEYKSLKAPPYYRSYLKVVNLLFLPKELQEIAFRHKKEWNLNSVTVHTIKNQNDIKEVGLYFP